MNLLTSRFGVLVIVLLLVGTGVTIYMEPFSSASYAQSGAFEVPSEEERKKAIGDTSELSEPLQRVFAPDELFEPVPEPDPGDWLAEHHEPGQTFGQYKNSNPNTPDENRNVIYLQPIGEFPEKKSPSLKKLKTCTSLFFTLNVKLLDPLKQKNLSVTSRKNPRGGHKQLLAPDLLNELKQRLPDDAFCMLGITMVDLYPEPSWNFVFGQASLRERVGVFSFARYDPAFRGKERTAKTQKLLLKRSCKILTHETGHMFGIEHCIYYRCQMNGSNHLQESDSRPIRYCPVCLRKLQHNLDFDPVKRYRNLREFYKKQGFDEAGWIKKRLKFIKKE